MLALFFLFNLIISITLLLLAPEGYDKYYCTVGFAIILINSILFLKRQIGRQGWLNFHLPFVISYFFVNIVYTVFIYPIDPEYFFIFEFGFNKKVLSKSLALSMIGLLSYFVAVEIYSSRFQKSLSSISINLKKIKLILFLTVSTFVLLIMVRGIRSFFSGYVDVITSLESPLVSPLLSIFTCLIFILISYKITEWQQSQQSLSKFIKSNILTFSLIGIVIILYSVGGSRTLIIQIGIAIICLYSLFIKRISGKQFIIFGACAFIVLGIMSRTRIETESQRKISLAKDFFKASKPIDFAMDFVIVNRNLFLAIDDVEKNGFSYGLKTSKGFFSFFPFYPAFVEKTFDLKQEDIDSETYFSTETNVNFSVGNNLIGDLYMILGVPSVIIGMFLLGWIIALTEKKATSNIYWLYVYSIFLSASVLYPRFSLFHWSRNIIWGLIIIKFINFKTKRGSTSNKVNN